MEIPWFVRYLSSRLDQIDRYQKLLDRQQNQSLQQGVDILRAIKELSDSLVGTVDHAIIVIRKLPQGATMATQGLVLPIDEFVELTILAFDKNGSPTTPKTAPVFTVSDDTLLTLAADEDSEGVDVLVVDKVKAGNSATVSATVDGVVAAGWQVGSGANQTTGLGPLPIVLAPGAVASAVIVAGVAK